MRVCGGGCACMRVGLALCVYLMYFNVFLTLEIISSNTFTVSQLVSSHEHISVHCYIT